MQNALIRRQMQLDSLSSRLSNANPINILKRGYAFVEHNGAPVKSVDDLQIGEKIAIQVVDGTINATVNDKEKK